MNKLDLHANSFYKNTLRDLLSKIKKKLFEVIK